MKNSELYKTLQDKESKLRKELRETLDEYNVPHNKKSKIMSLSRQISTIKNLKEVEGTK
jgi:glutamate-1-semialdehyde aminotransferase